MKLETSLIELRRVTIENPEDVEFLRNVRNSFLEKKVYAVEHFIEADEHQNWFASLNPHRDFFFIIMEKISKRRCGFIGCYQKKAPPGSGEISVFISAGVNSAFLPFHAMTLLLCFMFNELKLERAFGVFFRENERAIRFNAGFGFTICEEESRIIQTELTANRFREFYQRWRRFMPE